MQRRGPRWRRPIPKTQKNVGSGKSRSSKPRPLIRKPRRDPGAPPARWPLLLILSRLKTATKRLSFYKLWQSPSRPLARNASEPKLTRVAFRVSRLMEFCTRRELQNQTGHGVEQWPLVVLKELVDNALDACEEAEVAPVISIAVEPGSIVIEDNAGGIKTSTIKSILDYTIRVSSREAYVSPTRGAQGNALKTILAMGYVLDRERQDGNAEAVGVTIIETRGIEHRIEFRVDHVNNEPRIAHTTSPSPVKIGSRITISWPVIPYYGGATLLDYARGEFIRLAEGYVWFNPHLTLRGSWYGKEFINVAATNPDWKKWGPRNPTSPHWYDETRLQRYLAAHVARDRDLRRNRTVREFIAEFRGLSGTAVQRKVLEEVGCSHQSLAAFFGAEQVNRAGIAKLLASMRKHTKPVAAKASRRDRRGSSQATLPGRRRQRRHVQVPAAQRRDQRRHPIHRRVCFRAASIRPDAGRQHFSQVHHRRQLERRDQQSVPRLRIDRRRAGEHVGQGTGQCQLAGDLRAASGVGVHPIRRPRQELDHPHRQCGAAR